MIRDDKRLRLVSHGIDDGGRDGRQSDAVLQAAARSRVAWSARGIRHVRPSSLTVARGGGGGGASSFFNFYSYFFPPSPDAMQAMPCGAMPARSRMVMGSSAPFSSVPCPSCWTWACGAVVVQQAHGTWQRWCKLVPCAVLCCGNRAHTYVYCQLAMVVAPGAGRCRKE